MSSWITTLGKTLLNSLNIHSAGPDGFICLPRHCTSLFRSVTQSCPTLCDPRDYSTPGLPVYRQLTELNQTHVHRVTDAIQPSHPVIPFSCLKSFPVSGSFPMSFQVAKTGVWASALPMSIHYWFPLGWTGGISLQSKGFSRVFSNTTVQKHQFFSAQFCL